ncbi:MAG: carbamoyltransferase [Gemmatimonadaceae bacterium]
MASGYVLGISAFYHDSAACLLDAEGIVAAAQEERFTRLKGDERFPGNAARYCLDAGGIAAGDLDAVVFYEKPLLKFERLLETYLDIAPRGFGSFRRAGPLWMKERLFAERDLREGLSGYGGKLLYAEHHESHAASAYYPSPFDEAAVLTIDGVGEWATATIGVGRGAELELLEDLRFPDSVGLLYSAFTYQAGFKVNSGEYKLMGLAPFGQPRYVDRIYSHLLDALDDGSFRLDQRYFDYRGGLRMTNRRFDQLFDGPPRKPEAPITQREMDLASSVQVVCEDIVLAMARHAHRRTGLANLCMAGGVALNAVANGRLVREGPFSEVWVQPAAGDAGGALGAAYVARHKYFGTPRPAPTGDSMRAALLGPAFGAEAIRDTLDASGARYQEVRGTTPADAAAAMIADGQVVGWFQGRMEFGPRALGARSILADARDPDMQSRINQKIKFREGFRPFAPSVLSERATEYFEIKGDAPYMTVVYPVAETRRRTPGETGLDGLPRVHEVRSDIPAVTHLDHSARVQTVSRRENPEFYEVIASFDRLTGCPVVVNTSFNVRGEPIVCTPRDAYACFARTRLDALVIGPFIVRRAGQDEASLAAAAPGTGATGLD